MYPLKASRDFRRIFFGFSAPSASWRLPSFLLIIYINMCVFVYVHVGVVFMREERSVCVHMHIINICGPHKQHGWQFLWTFWIQTCVFSAPLLWCGGGASTLASLVTWKITVIPCYSTCDGHPWHQSTIPYTIVHWWSSLTSEYHPLHNCWFEQWLQDYYSRSNHFHYYSNKLPAEKYS